MSTPFRPLVLSGGPAVGKSTCGRALASARARSAFIDADDVRQLVVSGAETLWTGPEGRAQHALATRNTAALAGNLLRDGFDVVVADFVTTTTAALYRALLPQVLIVHLVVSRAEARRRASTRRTFLTDAEFELLHDIADTPPGADLVLDVEHRTAEEQVEMLGAAWAAASR